MARIAAATSAALRHRTNRSAEGSAVWSSTRSASPSHVRVLLLRIIRPHDCSQTGRDIVWCKAGGPTAIPRPRPDPPGDHPDKRGPSRGLLEREEGVTVFFAHVRGDENLAGREEEDLLADPQQMAVQGVGHTAREIDNPARQVGVRPPQVHDDGPAHLQVIGDGPGIVERLRLEHYDLQLPLSVEAEQLPAAPVSVAISVRRHLVPSLGCLVESEEGHESLHCTHWGTPRCPPALPKHRRDGLSLLPGRALPCVWPSRRAPSAADIRFSTIRYPPSGRGPKIARPMRTIVAPSSTATSKSSLIPIDRCANAGASPARAASSRNSRNRRNTGLTTSGWSTCGAIVINPTTRIPDNAVSDCNIAGTASGAIPNFWGSEATLTCTNTSQTRPACRTRWSNAIASATLSTEWMTSNNCTACRTLLRWRCPTRCQRTDPATCGRRCVIFGRASCTRFSPKSVTPLLAAACTCVGSTPLLTPTSTMSSTRRPPRRAAAAIRSRTRLTFAATSDTTGVFAPLRAFPPIPHRFNPAVTDDLSLHAMRKGLSKSRARFVRWKELTNHELKSPLTRCT